jgi:predicted transcriptional regulator
MADKELKDVVITIRVRQSTKDALLRLAERLDRSQAWVIEHLIRQAVKGETEPDKRERGKRTP